MVKNKMILGMMLAGGLSLLVSLDLALAKKPTKEPARTEQKGTLIPPVEKKGTPTTTEIEALGPTMSVSSIMSGLGRVGDKHKVLFIEVLEENYDTFLPGLSVKRLQGLPYFRFDKNTRKIVVGPNIFRWYSPEMLNSQGQIREDISLIVKHTLDYKGIGRRYPKYYIYEVSHVPEIINLKNPPFTEHQEYYIRFVDNLKITHISSEGEIEFIYDKEKIRLKPEESWKDKKRSKVIPIESDEYIKKSFNKWFNDEEMNDKIAKWLEVREKRPFGKGISKEDLQELRAKKVIFSTEVTIFNHGIVDVEIHK